MVPEIQFHFLLSQQIRGCLTFLALVPANPRIWFGQSLACRLILELLVNQMDPSKEEKRKKKKTEHVALGKGQWLPANPLREEPFFCFSL